MYRINLDVSRKIVYIEVSGSILLEEIETLIYEFINLVNKYDEKRYSMLILAQRLDPLSQDNLPVFQQFIEIAIIWTNKIALVYGNRTLTKMQLTRIESAIRNDLMSDTPLKIFKVINDAMNYLSRV